MIKKSIALSLMMITNTALANSSDVKIVNFVLDEVEICTSNDDCTDVSLNQLPDPKKENIIVKTIDDSQNMVMFEHNGIEKWIHWSEVTLNTKDVASVMCTSIAQADDKSTYATLGLGEGCK
ncbi:hypothetical protein PMAL9190_00409 [Photobacterium malacitanum]|uniref:Uncharacterized protein n=1 Tax=Photobacterium malacitanum TaxID=2204294 RepID=A0A1Y6M6L4_9GAMM|nr:hypothetical protein [Photobacterium malacitanum]SMY32206.1 hypothetical protein PMAL9190_00409 [Photobacterium malacitanum]